jgi:uncharacterized protein
MEQLIRQSRALAARTQPNPRRFLFDQIDWTWRLICIKGARGTGKTTMLLQRMAEVEQAIYLTLDDLWFTSHTLLETVLTLYQRGYTRFYLDEVHKYAGWSREIKNLYDLYPGLEMVITGSSIIELHKLDADLSRRVVIYELPGLSFREYLEFNGIFQYPALGLEQLFHEHEFISDQITQKIKPLQHFEAYLKHGYYPFYLESRDLYQTRLRQVVRLILETDIMQAEGISVAVIGKIGRLLQFVADAGPFKPNTAQIAGYLGIDRATLLRYLNHLAQARLITALHVPGGGLSALAKPDKLYLQNTNLLYAMASTQPEMGNVRETFLLSQLPKHAQVHAHDHADFLINNEWLVEVGGKSKKRKQLRAHTQGYRVLDDIEIGVDDQIPLWLFGFLY